MGLRRQVSLAAVALLAAAAADPAAAADRAGADQLQKDFNAFFADAARRMVLEIAPAAPVAVALDGDGYLATVGPFAISGAGEAVLAVDGFSIRLRPDDADRDLTHFALQGLPRVLVLVEGEAILELSADLIRDEGIWSDAIDMAVAEVTVIENLRLEASVERWSGQAQPLPVDLALLAGRLETRLQLTEHDDSSWTVDSGVVADELGVYAAGVVGADGVTPDPVTGLQATQHYGHVESRVVMTGVPLIAWRDFTLDWLQRLANLDGGEPDDPQAMLRVLLDELPRLPESVETGLLAEDIRAADLFVQRQQQSVEITGLAGDALTLRQRDRTTGVYLGSGSSPFVARLAPLAPNAYESDLVLRDLPVGHAWRALVGTIDAWIDAPDPDAAGEVFFRSFANRALAIGSAAQWTLALEWPMSRFEMDLDLAASEAAAMVVSGSIDGRFTGMAALGEQIGAALGPEAASGWLMLEAFGQRDRPAGDGPPVTRYLLEIGEDGQVRFNGQDYDAVVRMIEEAFDSGRGFGDLIPDQD